MRLPTPWTSAHTLCPNLSFTSPLSSRLLQLRAAPPEPGSALCPLPPFSHVQRWLRDSGRPHGLNLGPGCAWQVSLCKAGSLSRKPRSGRGLGLTLWGPGGRVWGMEVESGLAIPGWTPPARHTAREQSESLGTGTPVPPLPTHHPRTVYPSIGTLVPRSLLLKSQSAPHPIWPRDCLLRLNPDSPGFLLLCLPMCKFPDQDVTPPVALPPRPTPRGLSSALWLPLALLSAQTARGIVTHLFWRRVLHSL